MRSFIVNTNETRRPGAWRDMLNDRSMGKASVYYHRRKSICRISIGDYVYLYQTGIGVIAKGVAISEWRSADCDGIPDNERYVMLEFCWALDQHDWNQNAPRAPDINQRTSITRHFTQAVFEIDEEMARVIDSVFEARSASDG